jgi:ribosomal protein S18 acetylase RimI-like enzyme
MGVRIRQLVAEDRPAIREMLEACGAFSEEEVQVALEVLDAGVAGGLDGDYPLFAAEVEGAARGYVCIGMTPLTRGTWHLYWICVHPSVGAQGVGRKLQAHAEDFVRSRGGERLVLETSGRADYARARRFYERAGYRVVGRITDFYKPGDDCVFYCKSLIDTAAERIATGLSPGKGRGLFAHRSISRGELIEEAPVVVVPAAEVEHLDRTTLENYYFEWGEDGRDAALLLGSCSLCNHSYQPNAVFELQPERQTIGFVALRDIQPGEEITTNYNGAPEDSKPLWFDTQA